ncbi:MAG: hypothetical protein LC117_09025 [Bacteroidia bacterium]|nr:hypothetical protein [Bacteroidia bacterium]MCZ2278054.1 hypothetical protein [Bacteroidia bacterium]
MKSGFSQNLIFIIVIQKGTIIFVKKIKKGVYNQTVDPENYCKKMAFFETYLSFCV